MVTREQYVKSYHIKREANRGSAEVTMVHLQLRLPPELHKKLAAMARREMRSLNGEIVWRLARSLEK